MFTPDLDFLAPQQRRLWRVLSEVPDDFVLYGGTALTLRLGHRKSVDFDFFANRRFEPGALEREISWLQGAVRQQSAPNSLVVLVDRGGPVNVSFFGGLSLRRVHDPETAKVVDVTALPVVEPLRGGLVPDRR